MKLSSMLKLAAMVVAVCGLVLFVAAPEAQAQANPPGLSKGKDKNGGNNGQPPGQDGNNNSKRSDKCKGNGCDDQILTPQEVTDIATEDGGIVLDCTLPEFSADPRCVTPTKKKAKRKVVSVKLSNDEQIAPPVATVVEAAPAPVVTPAPVVAPAAVVAPAPKPKSSTIIDPNDLTSNTFQ